MKILLALILFLSITCVVIFNSCSSCDTVSEEMRILHGPFVDDEWLYVYTEETVHKVCSSLSGESGGSTEINHYLVRYKGEKEKHNINKFLKKYFGNLSDKIIDVRAVNGLLMVSQITGLNMVKVLLADPKQRKKVYLTEQISYPDGLVPLGRNGQSDYSGGQHESSILIAQHRILDTVENRFRRYNLFPFFELDMKTGVVSHLKRIDIFPCVNTDKLWYDFKYFSGFYYGAYLDIKDSLYIVQNQNGNCKVSPTTIENPIIMNTFHLDFDEKGLIGYYSDKQDWAYYNIDTNQKINDAIPNKGVVNDYTIEIENTTYSIKSLIDSSKIVYEF